MFLSLADVNATILEKLGKEAYDIYQLYSGGFTIPLTHLITDENIESDTIPIGNFSVFVSFLDESYRYKDNNYKLPSYIPCVTGKNLIAELKKFRNIFGIPNLSFLVQVLINSKKSGIVTSLNPLYYDEKEIVINTIFGSYFPLIKSKISPSTALIESETGKVILRRSFKQKYAYFFDEECRRRRVFVNTDAFPLTIDEIKRIYSDVVKMRSLLRYPFGVFFVIDSQGNLYYTNVFRL